MPNPPTQWTITPGNQGPGPNNLDLVGCQIKKVTDANGNLQYAFFAPGVGSGPPSQVSITTTGTTTSYPALPCQFPMFNSALSQGAGAQSQPWYITICSLTAGQSQNSATGTDSNSAYQSCPAKLADVDPDVWVATANTTPEEEEEASAASA